MDGVIYRGNELIPGAKEFIQRLRGTDTRFLFLTNNRQRTRRDDAMKLCRMGIKATNRDIFTCSMATPRFVAQQKPGGSDYVIGEGGLLNALHQNGYSIVDDHPDYAIVGEGRTMTPEMVESATGKKAFSVGKPSPVMKRSARKQLGLTSEETFMVGDSMETDILAGSDSGQHRPILSNT